MGIFTVCSNGKQASTQTVPSPVVQLNVGGQLFSTTLSTLRKHPDSRLAELFSGHPKPRIDAQGRLFIDRDGTHFGPVLEFLRSEKLPTENIREVHEEAVHYGIKALVKRLEETPQMFGELVGRQQFLSRVPHYKENIEVRLQVSSSWQNCQSQVLLSSQLMPVRLSVRSAAIYLAN
uniref:Potassium channel tetramerization domain containing 14 n=1 Tax=Nothobranchius furzeri TaxID=105023 RepID=A0A8C6NWV8_NOTFU